MSFHIDSSFAVLLALLLAPESGSTAQSVRLNGRLVEVSGSLLQEASTADGKGVVYLAEQDSAVAELYYAPITGGPGERISAPLAPGERLVRFELAADSRHVAYFVEGTSGHHLFGLSLSDRRVVELDASTEADGRVINYDLMRLFAPDGAHVLYLAEVPSGEVRLFSAALAGGAPIRLSGPTGSRVRQGYAATADSRNVVFVADLDRTGRFELYRAALDGSQAPFRLTPMPTRDAGDVGESFALSPDGLRVVASSTLTSTRPVLWSLPLAGGDPIALDLPSSSALQPEPVVTPDGVNVLFIDSPSSVPLLYRAPIDGSGPTVALSGGLPLWAGFRLADDGAHVVFEAASGVSALYSVPVAGGPPVPLVSGATLLASFQIVPGGRHVLYEATAFDGSISLRSVPIQGGASVLLGDDLRSAAVLSPNGRMVAFRTGDDRQVRMIGVQGFPVVELPSDANRFAFTGDSRRLLVQDDLELRYWTDLFQFAIVGGQPTKLSGILSTSNLEGGAVRSFVPAGEDVVYLAQESAYPDFQLYAVEADGSARRRLDPPGASRTDVREDFQVTADGSRVVFVRRNRDGSEALYSALVNGGGAVLLSPTPSGLTIRSFAIGPRGGLVAYTAAKRGNLGHELFVVRMSGGPSLHANRPLQGEGDIPSFEFAGAGKLFYRVSDDLDGFYSVRLPDLAQVRLDPLDPQALPMDYRLGAGGTELVFRRFRAGVVSLQCVPTDGSSLPREVTLEDGSPIQPDSLPLELTSDGLEFVFLRGGHPFVADFARGKARPIGADVLQPGDRGRWVALDPTGARLCFQRETSTESALYLAARAGGPSLRVQVDDADFALFTPDGAQLVCTNGTSLFVASSLDGSARELVVGITPQLGSIQLDRDGQRVAYLDGAGQLQRVALDGLSAPQRVNELDARIEGFQLGRERVFYLAAPPAQDFRVELYSRLYSSLP